ncbi:MAG: glycosyltransferase family 1 protein [Chitinophagaceae bacterium]
MIIGFDAKRAFHNTTGLGYYSRTLIELLATHYPQHQYVLFNPKASGRFPFLHPSVKEVRPTRFPDTLLTSLWRSSRVIHEFGRYGIDLYHGLSHEIPVGIDKTGVPAIVTIHDLIHERYPDQYKAFDRKIYTRKYKYACRHSARVIATSEQTKRDLADMYGVDAQKIDVCYQSCSPEYAVQYSREMKQEIAQRYGLPPRFFLSVGTIITRKNLLNVCKALYLLRNELDIPLVVVGKGHGVYYQQVKDFILQNGLNNRVIFLSEQPAQPAGYLSTPDLVGIYQLAEAMIYPSFFEGFGMPVMEALWSGLPVITSNVSCMPEVGGHAALYADPNSSEEIAACMKRVCTEPGLREEMQQKGWLHTQAFTPEKYVASVMQVYEKI